MRTTAVAFILSMLCAAVLTPLVRRLAYRFGALDQALSARKIHGRPVPRLGGIAIVGGFFVPLLALLVFQSDVGALFLAEQNLALGIFVGGTLIAILGIYDDLRGADAKKKFAVQFLVAGLMYYLGFRINELANPFGDPIQLGWVSIPFTLLWVVGVINAMNLVDGLDGLAGGVALVAVSTILLVSIHHVQPLMILFCAALAGAILGFLFYNFNPASIFMGDTGSMFLGFVLATSSIKTGHKSSTAITVVMVILGFPILDTLLAMSRRALRGRPMFHADKEHIHHRLLALGLSHRNTVLVLYAVCLLFAGVALGITYSETPAITITLLAVLATITFLFLRRLGYIRFEINHYLSDQRRRNRARQVAVRPFVVRLRQAVSMETIWDIVRDVPPVFEATCVVLQMGRKASTTPKTMFSSGFTNDSSHVFRIRFILVSGQVEGLIELGWEDGRSELDRDIEISVELFSNHVVEAYARIRSRTSIAMEQSEVSSTAARSSTSVIDAR